MTVEQNFECITVKNLTCPHCGYNDIQIFDWRKTEFECPQCKENFQIKLFSKSLKESLPKQVLDVCKKRGWDLHWTHRGSYLHLESSELIESIRGKGDSTPLEEAADVLFVLMSITENQGIPWSDVEDQLQKIVNELNDKPHYKGEEYDEAKKEK